MRSSTRVLVLTVGDMVNVSVVFVNVRFDTLVHGARNDCMNVAVHFAGLSIMGGAVGMRFIMDAAMSMINVARAAVVVTRVDAVATVIGLASLSVIDLQQRADEETRPWHFGPY